MGILLDTHIFLWYINDDVRLPVALRDLITDGDNDVFLSSMSIWECCIKQQAGKLELPDEAAAYLTAKREQHGIEALPFEEGCLPLLSALPLIHKDPFDRIMICQSMSHGLRFMTQDTLIIQYEVKGFQVIS